jgi:hypothetical protein
MRMMIQTGRYIAPVDGRRASMKDGQLLTPEQIRRIEAQLQNGMKSVVTLVGNEVKQTGKAIDAVYNRQAQELGMSLKEFRKGTSSMAEFDKRMAGYDQYQKWREQHTTIDMQSGREIVARGNPYEQFAKWGTFRVDGQRYNDLVKLIQQRDQQAGQAYTMQSQAYRTMNRAEGITVSKLMRGGAGGGATGGKGATKAEQTELQQNQAKINELTQQYVTLMAAASKAGQPLTDEQQKQTSEIQRQISELEKRNGLLKLYEEQAHGRLLGNTTDITNAQDLSRTGGLTGFVGVGKDMMPIEGLPSMSEVVRQRGGNLLDDKAMKAVNKDISRNLPNVKEDDKRDDPLKEAKKQNQKLEGIGSDISGMLSGLEKMGIEIPEGLSSMVGGIQTITGIISSILTLVTLISSIQSVKSIPIIGWALANGGIAGGLGGRRPIHAAGGTVVGNTYSGDQIPAMLNAGEVVLSKAQAGIIASDLEGGGMKNLKLDAVITGEQIRLVLNNNSRRRGKGEYITSTHQ